MLATIASLIINACAAFSGAAWAARKRTERIEKTIAEHVKKDEEFHAKVEAAFFPCA